MSRNTFILRGFWEAVCRNPDGTVAWRERFKNGTCTAGLSDMLSVYFASGTQKTSWYAGLINDSGFSALAAADTIATHAGWSELTGYAESVRPTFTPGTPSNGILYGTVAAVTFNALGTVKGAFLVSNNTKGGSTGILFATGLFSQSRAVLSGQTLSFSYTCTATGG